MEPNKAYGANFFALELSKIGDTFYHGLSNGSRLEGDKVPQKIFGEIIFDDQLIQPFLP
jgi:hypothetical protein